MMRRGVASGMAALVAAVLVTGCSNATAQPLKPADQPTVPITEGQPFTLRAGQRAALNADEVVVSFVNVSEDSRCPSDVTCVRAGDVTAVFRVVVRGQALGDKSLTQMEGQPATAELNGYTLTLSSISPYPVSTTPIKASDYQATLMLSLSR